MKTITKYILGLAVAVALTGCKDKMRELNSNPDTIGETQPEYMFTNATWQWMHNTRDMISSSYSSVGQLMQYFVHYTYGSSPYADPTAGNYPNTRPFSNYWSQYYTDQVGNKLHSLVAYIDEQIPESERAWYGDIKAISQILQTYYVWQLFDVNGAAVYTQAFRYNEGLMTPEYDYIWDVYKDLDAVVKEQIAVLSAEPVANNVELGRFDFFYGWKSIAQTGGGVVVTQTDDYTTQRTNWLKMANVFRLKMAWRFKSQDPAHFSQVLSEVTANPANLFTSIEEGCYYHMDDDYIQNSDDISDISMYYYVTDNFITHLKNTDDPRLPLLARINNMHEGSTSYTWLQKFAPDSLVTKKLWNYQTNTLETLAWGELTEVNNVYQGMSANAAQRNVGTKPGELLATRNIEIKIHGPYYDPSDPSKPVPAWTLTSADGTETVTIYGQDTTIALRAASAAQGRYFIRSAGKNTSTNSSGGNGGDGPAEDWTIKMRRPILTYAEQCLMLAYLATEQGTSIAGKSAEDWYNEGVVNALTELQQDAWRYKVQIASNIAHAQIPTVNPTGLYQITEAMIQDYLTANSYSSMADPKELIAAQAWVYFYTNPQEMWGWWKLTGYPRIAKVFTPAERKNYPYLQQPYETDNSATTAETATMYAFPRRNTIPTTNTSNNANYLKARETLVGQTNPTYGGFGETTGRIWWDTKEPVQ